MQIGYKILFHYKGDIRTKTESTSKIFMYIKMKSNSLNLMFEKFDV